MTGSPKLTSYSRQFVCAWPVDGEGDSLYGANKKLCEDETDWYSIHWGRGGTRRKAGAMSSVSYLPTRRIAPAAGPRVHCC